MQLAGWRACVCVVVVGSVLVSSVRCVCGIFVITRPCLFSSSTSPELFFLARSPASLRLFGLVYLHHYSRMFGPRKLVIGPQLFGFAAPLL